MAGTHPNDIELAVNLVDHDHFGEVFNERTPEADKKTPAQLIEVMKSRAADLSRKIGRFSARDLYRLNLLFYISDAGSYPVVRNDYFEIDPKGRLVPKSPKFRELENLAAGL